jgi:mycothiol synthase
MHMTELNFLPEGFKIRHATAEDLQAVVEVIRAYDLVQQGETHETAESWLPQWQRPGFDLANDAWVIIAPRQKSAAVSSAKERIVGYQELWNRAEHSVLSGDGYVHPEFNGLGIGTTMLHLEESRAREHLALAPPQNQVILRNGVAGNDPAAQELHKNEGYQPARYFWQMEIQMSKRPPEPVWPQGFQLTRFERGENERQAFDAFEDAFRDHWGYTPWDFDWWLKMTIENENSDSGLRYLALDEDQIAGGVLCEYRQELGWVSQLAVRRPWRRRGLGLALLLHAFGEFYRRGTTTVRLGVDAANPTGATRLYEKAGMQVLYKFIVYEKELRSGIAVAE